MFVFSLIISLVLFFIGVIVVAAVGYIGFLIVLAVIVFWIVRILAKIIYNITLRILQTTLYTKEERAQLRLAKRGSSASSQTELRDSLNRSYKIIEEKRRQIDAELRDIGLPEHQVEAKEEN